MGRPAHIPADRLRVAGALEQAAYERAARDHEELPGRGFQFDAAAGERVVRFFADFLRHWKGPEAGKPFILSPWQEFCVREIFGWKTAEGRRRFRTAYISVPRKQGKTTLAGGILLYGALADGEQGAELYSAATSRDQAAIAFESAVQMARRSPVRRFVRIRTNCLTVPQTTSKISPLSADYHTLDGRNPHMAVIDELHAHRNRRILDVMTTGTAARANPLTMIITTAGIFDPESVGWKTYDYARSVLLGTFDDDRLFAYVTEADPEDDWRDPAVWLRANPGLGDTIRPEYFEGEVQRAGREPSYLPAFLRFHLNLWVQASESWLPVEAWDECGEPLDDEVLRRTPCFAGLDLASRTDLSAFVLVFPIEGGPVAVRAWFWVPEAAVRRVERYALAPYAQWAEEGWLRVTSGDVVDYSEVVSQISKLGQEYRIVEIGYDPWNAYPIVQDLESRGFRMVEVRQGFGSLSAPTKQLEALVLSRQLRHGGNPVLRWMANNVVIATSPNGDVRPDRNKSKGKIDGIVGLIIALSRALGAAQAAGRQSVYEERGVLFL